MLLLSVCLPAPGPSMTYMVMTGFFDVWDVCDTKLKYTLLINRELQTRQVCMSLCPSLGFGPTGKRIEVRNEIIILLLFNHL